MPTYPFSLILSKTMLLLKDCGHFTPTHFGHSGLTVATEHILFQVYVFVWGEAFRELNYLLQPSNVNSALSIFFFSIKKGRKKKNLRNNSWVAIQQQSSWLINYIWIKGEIFGKKKGRAEIHLSNLLNGVKDSMISSALTGLNVREWFTNRLWDAS